MTDAEIAAKAEQLRIAVEGSATRIETAIQDWQKLIEEAVTLTEEIAVETTARRIAHWLNAMPYTSMSRQFAEQILAGAWKQPATEP